MIRDVVDSECSHNNGGDRVGSAVAGVGDCAVGLGGRPSRSHGLLFNHLLHLQPSC